MGVDRKTVLRWIQGQVKSIQVENAERLATILNCRIEDLRVADGELLFASAEDQKIAAAALLKSSVMYKLGAVGEWDIIESLLKATIIPNLPLNILGELYNRLTIASWRQSKMDQSEVFNQRTLEIALKTKDQVLLASAMLSKANLFSWRGQTLDSIAIYRECLKIEKYLEPRLLGSIHSNLGGVLFEAGHLDEGLIEVKKSLVHFKLSGKPINLSIAHTHLALIYLQQNQIDHSFAEVQKLTHYATQDDYRRGLHFGKLISGEIEARKGNFSASASLTDEGLRKFSEMGIDEGLNYEIAGRTYRLQNALAVAESLIAKGISISEDFPIYQAALYVEMAEVLKAQNRTSWKDQLESSISLYTKCQCPLRVQMIKQRFELT